MIPIPTAPNVQTQFILYRSYPDGSLDVDIPVYYPAVDTPSIFLDSKVYSNNSWIIICGHCGELWARRCLVGKPNDSWNVRIWPCRACGHGSLWDRWNPPWNKSLPPKLLFREMDLVQGWYDKGVRTYNDYFHLKHFRKTV